MSTITRKFPLADEMQEQLNHAREQLAKLTLHDEYTIEDYPSGRHRVKCRLGVEFKKGKGSRTVRATTDKYGRWCNPKKSTYAPGLCLVVTGEPVEKEAAWLTVNLDIIGLHSANGNWTTLAKAPCAGAPRREDLHYTVSSRSLSMTDIMRGATLDDGEKKEEQKVLPADPPELCDSYDVWKNGVLEIMAWMIERKKELDTTAA
ncbi:MAG: hypothetical protein NXI32_22190 [bacterium]|nr:hypothetical protein [bacterium]